MMVDSCPGDLWAPLGHSLVPEWQCRPAAEWLTGCDGREEVTRLALDPVNCRAESELINSSLCAVSVLRDVVRTQRGDAQTGEQVKSPYCGG